MHFKRPCTDVTLPTVSARHSSTEIHIFANEQTQKSLISINNSCKSTQTVFSKYGQENHIRNIPLSLKNNKTTLTELD